MPTSSISSENEKGLSPKNTTHFESVAKEGVAAAFDEHGNALVETDPAAEARLRRKIDFFVVPIFSILYLFCFIDRTNIGNARLAGLEKDLGMKGYDYNIALSIFYITYIVVEIPSNVACKAFGPKFWIPSLSFAFGLVSMCTAFVNSYGGLIATRFFLGAAEAGMMPGIAYAMSRWYRKSELVFRLSLYIIAAPLAGAFGGLLASGILSLDGIGSVHSWKMIYLVEGIISMGLAIFAFIFLADGPATARWLNAEERALAEVRIKSENIGTVTVLEGMHKKALRRGILNINSTTIGFIFLVNNITVQGISIFLPTLINSLYPHDSTIHKQLKTVPPYVVGAFFVLLVGYLAWKTSRRAIHMIWTAVFAVVGSAMYLGEHDTKVRYGGTFLMIAGAFPFGALCNGWASPNLSPDSSRAGGIGLVVMMGNVGGLVSTWTFLPRFAPDYNAGIGLQLATAVVEILLAGGLWVYQSRENKLRETGGRDYRLDGLTPDEIAVLGHKHPGFRYSH